MKARNRHWPIGVLLWMLLGVAMAENNPAPQEEIDRLLQLVTGDESARNTALAFVDRHWRPEFTIMVLEAAYLTRDAPTAAKLITLLEQKTGQHFGYAINTWYVWLWNRPPRLHPLYAQFKSRLYGLIDPKFSDYFSPERTSTIRLDEVRWGGVVQDGIPPLRHPKMIPAGLADYLEDSDIVFGLAVNGAARAYPKRILAWHEMFTDDIGGVPVTGVYCTLCGAVIPYVSRYRGVTYRLGTSGFLYRSNKLMYDQATQSLWNTLWGKPVIGPLAEQDVTLERLSIVTTTWGQWRHRHPNTQVLSLDTGYRRDYSEGAAYHDYFATDDLMFNVPQLDKRLKNKDEVLALLFREYPDQPLAISAAYLARNPLYYDRIGRLDFVVLTDSSGANRVYEARGVKFVKWDGDHELKDDKGVSWTLDEDKLLASDGRALTRLPAHRAFWFGWYAAYTHTRLVD
ncbi:MAG: DUF3179 domain-containing protein [Gammaproteobacteria bacterium]|nr:DUF3179 domain-containing protein [Gammaproteobacteria bacterium]